LMPRITYLCHTNSTVFTNWKSMYTVWSIMFERFSFFILESHEEVVIIALFRSVFLYVLVHRSQSHHCVQKGSITMFDALSYVSLDWAEHFLSERVDFVLVGGFP